MSTSKSFEYKYIVFESLINHKFTRIIRNNCNKRRHKLDIINKVLNDDKFIN